MSQSRTLHVGVSLPPFHPNDESRLLCMERDFQLMQWLDAHNYAEDPASSRMSRRGTGSRAEHRSIGGWCLRTAERKPMLCDQNECRNEDDKRRDQSRHPNTTAARGEIPLIILRVRHLAIGTRSHRASVPLQKTAIRRLGAFATIIPRMSIAEVKHEFQRQDPCPSTGRPTGPCPSYIKDHIVSLACGGPDGFFYSA